MKQFIALILLFLYSENQQLPTGKYLIDMESEQVACELLIGTDHTYEVRLSVLDTEDIVWCAILSNGHYSSSKDNLLLHDDHYSFNWELSISDNLVNVSHGYCFLNKKRILSYQKENVDILPPNKEYLNRINTQIEKYIVQQDNPHVELCQYEDRNHHYTLAIENNGGYHLYLKDILVSEGKWSQQDNILVLHDMQLDHDFTMAVGNRTLLSIGIPGEFGGTMFEIVATSLKNDNNNIITPRNHRGGCSRIINQ